MLSGGGVRRFLILVFSDPNWVYNLSTANLGPGTLTITIQMPDGRQFNAGFVLR